MKDKKSIEPIKSKIIKILKKHGVVRAGIFGSYARGEQNEKSDIDILIQPSENMSLLDLSGLKIELEENLGRKVDLVSYKYIHPYLKERILESEMRII
ncbi:MAG: nucleotidyltransferase family protein [Nanoarchaeota archaeon]